MFDGEFNGRLVGGGGLQQNAVGDDYEQHRKPVIDYLSTPLMLVC